MRNYICKNRSDTLYSTTTYYKCESVYGLMMDQIRYTGSLQSGLIYIHIWKLERVKPRGSVSNNTKPHVDNAFKNYNGSGT